MIYRDFLVIPDTLCDKGVANCDWLFGAGPVPDHLKELLGKPRDVPEPGGLDPPVGPVAIYLRGGTVAEGVSELDINVIFDALMHDL